MGRNALSSLKEVKQQLADERGYAQHRDGELKRALSSLQELKLKLHNSAGLENLQIQNSNLQKQVVDLQRRHSDEKSYAQHRDGELKNALSSLKEVKLQNEQLKHGVKAMA